MSLLEECREDYRDALERFLGGAGEDALSSAYELGRRALAGGLGILDMVSLHHEAVSQLRQRETQVSAGFSRAAGSFLIETLSPFEMSYRAVDEANLVLRRLNELLEEEMKRVAHALHDQAGSVLAMAAIEFDLVAEELPPEGRERLAGVRGLLDETGEQLRHFSHELRPTILDDLGLRPALDFLAEGMEQRADLTVNVRGRLRERLPAPVETAVYRIVQEALNNAFLHGGESPTVNVSIERESQQLRCVVADDGAGFDVAAVLSGRGKRGLGLLGMRERAAAVKGRCDIVSAPGQGTTVEIVVPLEMSTLRSGIWSA